MKNSKGFTITEALISVALVGIAITMFGYLINSFSLARKGQISSSAINYARTVTDSTITLWRRNEFFKAEVLPQNLTAPPNGYSINLLSTPSPTGTAAAHTLACTSTCTFNNSPLATVSADTVTSKQIDVTVKDNTGSTILVLSTVVAKPTP